MGTVGKGCACQSSSMFPGEGHPIAVTERISDSVICNGLSVIGCQQVFPSGIPVGIDDRIRRTARCTCRICIFFPVQDIPTVIVGICECFSARLVILPHQLAELVIDIGPAPYRTFPISFSAFQY